MSQAKHKAASRPIKTWKNNAATSSLSVIDLLVQQGVAVDARDKDGNTFLHILLISCTTPTSTQLHQFAVTYGHLFNEKNEEEQTVLQTALARVKFEISTLSLLYKKGVEFKAVDKSGQSALVYAVEGHQSMPVLSKLIEFGVDPNRLDNINRSVLHKAAEEAKRMRQNITVNACLSVIDFLIKQGVKLNAQDRDGNTFLHVLFGLGTTLTSTHLIQLVVKYGLLFNVRNHDAETALNMALQRVDNQNEEVVSKLIEYELDYKRLNSYNDTLLHYVAMYGNADAVAIFIKAGGLDINGKNMVGYTPLHCVGFRTTPKSKPLEVVRLLLDNGASKTIKDNNGDIPYDYIKTFRTFPEKEKVLQLLR